MPTSTATHSPTPDLPIPIYQPSISVARFLLYDVSHISYLRSHHAILGVLIGTLPQIPQQSVFLGLPLELQPEEAQLLVDNGIAYIVNDRDWHDKDFRRECGWQRENILENLRNEGLEIAKGLQTMKNARTRLILQEQGRGKDKSKRAEQETGKRGRLSARTPSGAELKPAGLGEAKSNPSIDAAEEQDDAKERTEKEDEQDQKETLFGPSRSSKTSSSPPPKTKDPPTILNATRSRSSSVSDPKPWTKTPTTSTSILTQSTSPHPHPHQQEQRKQGQQENSPLHKQTKHTLPLFTHLHSKNYYLTPGLRFGCHFSVYPGDPLRFHAHFLANAYAWTEEREVLEIVGGGRLGTGVKKGWLVGGRVERDDNDNGEATREGVGEGEGEVRCFCIEWGGM